MTLLFVALLAGFWVALFLPALLRARKGASPIVSVSTFNRGMRALGSGHPSSNGRWIVVPPTRQEDEPRRQVVERRRQVFMGLVAATAATALLGLLPALRVLLWLNLTFDLALAGFVMFLLQEKRRSGNDLYVPASGAPISERQDDSEIHNVAYEPEAPAASLYTEPVGNGHVKPVQTIQTTYGKSVRKQPHVPLPKSNFDPSPVYRRRALPIPEFPDGTHEGLPSDHGAENEDELLRVSIL